MTPDFLLDTHVVVRWLIEPKKLSKEQTRALRTAFHRQHTLALSAITLLEIAALSVSGKVQTKGDPNELLNRIEASPTFFILPITFEIATEFASLAHHLHDPADRAIVATARVHRLRLLTSDQRIIAARFVATIE